MTSMVEVTGLFQVINIITYSHNNNSYHGVNKVLSLHAQLKKCRKILS